MKNLRKIPEFKNEDEEREFWATHSMVDYFDMDKALVNPTFPNLKFSTKKISIRMPESMLNTLKMEANRRDVPYQSLMKVLLGQKLQEMRG